MSQQLSRVACLILEETFGAQVERVGAYLVRHGALTVGEIARGTSLKTAEVKKCLSVLLQHRILDYSPHHADCMAYQVNLTSLLHRVLFPRYIHMAKEIGGEVGELIVEDLLRHGLSLMDQSVSRVVKELKEGGMEENMEVLVRTQFEALASNDYLMKITSSPSELNPAPTPEPARDGSPASKKKRKRPRGEKGGGGGGREEGEPAMKRHRSDGDGQGDDEALWYISGDRFDQKMRNESIALVAAEAIDTTAGTIMKTILSLSPHSPTSQAQVFPLQIMGDLPPSMSLSHSDLEQYLTLLVEEELLHRTGDSSGGTYHVDYKKATELVCRATVESIVRERFGSKPLRIFRLLLLKQHLEQKQVSDMALVPNKEAKEILYSLLSENFISLQEIPRATDYAPSRTFYLFSVNLQQVARMMLQRCYKALGNLMARRNHESNENKRLLEKYQLWEKQQQLGEGQEGMEESEVEEVLTPEERKTAERVKLSINKLEQGELQLVPTITTLQDYLSFL